MSFNLKVQCTIHAPIEKVWEGLTNPELVKQYFFGTQLVTTWQPQTPIYFRGEWDGKAYEDKGIVLKFVPHKILEYDYLSSWSNLGDRPENYQIITYRVKSKADSTVFTIAQNKIDTLEHKVDSIKNWKALMVELKKLMENAHN
jgi:uncharacterized protein YndB with AHSA1/START domain